MNKKKAGLSLISLLIVGVFFLSCLYMNISITLDCGNILRKVVISADRNNMNVFQQQLTDGQLKTSEMSNRMQIKHFLLRKPDKAFKMLMPFTYVAIILLISGVLCQKGQGRLFARFITYVYHKTRFLYELFIGKKKDGKKWTLLFVNIEVVPQCRKGGSNRKSREY